VQSHRKSEWNSFIERWSQLLCWTYSVIMKLVPFSFSRTVPKGRVRKGLLGFLSLLTISGLLVSKLNAPSFAIANTQSKTITVATRLVPPFVMGEQGKLTGFSVDLWQKISEQIDKKSTLVVYPSLSTMLRAVEQKKADVAIAAISITAEREQKFDFSYPMFASGLKILVRDSKSSGFVPNVLRDLFSPALMQIIGLAFVMVMVAAHLIWVLERRHPNSSISEQYFPGIFEAVWWSASTLATQAEEMPRGALGRVLAVFWMFIAVLFVAYFTATVTPGMTVQTLQGDIKGIEDLKGRVTATITNSTAAEYLQSRGLKTLEVDQINAAYAALLNKNVDAVLFDAPVLLYYAAHEGQGKVSLIGETLRDENYGILLPMNSPNRKPINEALLSLKENSTYQSLYVKWFKSSSDNPG
jgi:polar amino acid transport system substrate-binding protein